MAWVELDDTFVVSVPVIRAGPLAVWLHIAMLCRCARTSSVRVNPGDVSELLRERRASASDLAERLVTVGLWRAVPGGWEIVDTGQHRFVDGGASKC